uniref:Uncharacterized protein n=1 Tax=Tanacetum cinerariifolium TaxID=118510 RepID=A0A6L2P3C5_TANCI|nr:hypothetical protein [Tanacetum cinerariifolium]
MLGKTPNKVYDPFLKIGLGYKNPECLKKAIAAQLKMYDGEKLHSVNLKFDSPDSKESGLTPRGSYEIFLDHKDIRKTSLIETLDYPFFASVNSETIKVFMNKVGYQGVVDKAVINRTNVDYAALLWWDFMNNVKQKKEAIQSTPRAYRTPTRTASPLEKNRKQSAGESSSPHKSLKITIRQQKLVEGNKDDDESKNMLEPGSHKEKPKYVDDDDDDDDDEKGAKNVDEKEGCEIEVLDLVSQEFNAQAPIIIEDLFKNYVQSNVIQVHPTTTTSTETTSSADLQQQLNFKMDDDIHSHHNDHQEDDAPLEGEKRVKRQKASKSLKSARGSSSKNSDKDSTTYVSKQQQQQQQWDA